MGTIRGYTEPSVLVRRRWTRIGGFSTVYEYAGTLDDMLVQANILRISCDDTEIIEDGTPVAKLVATFADSNGQSTEESPPEWELLALESNDSIFSGEAFAALPTADQVLLKKLLTRFEAGDPLPDTFFWSDEPNGPHANIGNALFTVGKHADTIYNDAWVLRKTQTTSVRSDLAIALDGMRELWSTAQVVASEGTLYNSIRLAMENGPVPPDRDEYVWSWLKKRPTFTARAWNKVQIVQEWVQAQWPPILYDIHG